MTAIHTSNFAELIRSRRIELGLSASQAARNAGMTPSTLTRLENGESTTPTAPSLQSLGEALDIRTADLFAALGWTPQDELPTLTPYLRRKYHDMPPDAIAEIEKHFAQVARDHGISVAGHTGPINHEDE